MPLTLKLKLAGTFGPFFLFAMASGIDSFKQEDKNRARVIVAAKLFMVLI